MNRTQLITLLLVLLTGIGVASAKPKVAVLGLEQVDKAGSKATQDAARAVTEGLRQASRAGGPFDASDTQRELSDEKMLAGCGPDSREAEERECVKKIATTLAVGAVVYGKVALVDGKKNLEVRVWLLNLDRSAPKNATVTTPASSSAAELQGVGKKLYSELTGAPPPAATGGFSFKTKAPAGIVYINGEPRGQIANGEYKSPPLADGEYKIRVEADGYKKLEDTVRVKNGQFSSIEVKLEEKETVKPPPDDEDKASRPVLDGDKPSVDLRREGTVSNRGSRTGWKVAAVTGVVMAAAGGSWFYLSYRNAKQAKDDIPTGYSVASIKDFAFEPDCSEGQAKVMGPSMTGDDYNQAVDAFKKGCKGARDEFRAGILAGTGVVIGLVGTYMGFIRSDSGSEREVASKRTRKPRFAVTPVISPDGGGATFRLDF